MKRLINKNNLTYEDWKDFRRKGIGGSDIAGICGLSKWATPLSVYLSKVENMDTESNIAMELGLYLEPFLRRKVEEEIKRQEGIELKVRKNNFILADDTFDYMMVNLDGEINHPKYGKCPVELKTASEYSREKWSDGKMPDEYYAQVQWQLMIYGSNYAYVGYLIGNNTFEVKVIERDNEMIKLLRNRAIDFMENYIKPKNPPVPSGTDVDDAIIKRLYPIEKESLLELSQEEIEYWEKEMIDYDNFIAEKKAIDAKISELKQRIMLRLGNYELMQLPSKNISFKTIKKEGYYVADLEYRALSIRKAKK